MPERRSCRQEHFGGDPGIRSAFARSRVPLWPERLQELRLAEHVPEVKRVVGTTWIGQDWLGLLHPIQVVLRMDGVRAQLLRDTEMDIAELALAESRQPSFRLESLLESYEVVDRVCDPGYLHSSRVNR